MTLDAIGIGMTLTRPFVSRLALLTIGIS